MSRSIVTIGSKPNPINGPVRNDHTTVHLYNGTPYCSTETVLLIFPFIETNIINKTAATKILHHTSLYDS